MMVQWRRIGKQVILGSRPHCPDKEASNITQDCPYTEAPCDSSILEDAGCAFDGNVLTHYRSTIPSVFVPRHITYDLVACCNIAAMDSYGACAALWRTFA